MHRAVLERSTERFSVRITALLLTTFECGRCTHFTCAGYCYFFRILKLWAFVGACLGCACCVMWSPTARPNSWVRRFSIWRERRCLSSICHFFRWRWGLHDGLLYWCQNFPGGGGRQGIPVRFEIPQIIPAWQWWVWPNLRHGRTTCFCFDPEAFTSYTPWPSQK